MALNKDVLGLALYNVRVTFSNKTIDQINTEYGGIEQYRLALAKAEADEIISHFKTAGEGKYITGTLQAGANVVTPNAPINMTIN